MKTGKGIVNPTHDAAQLPHPKQEFQVERLAFFSDAVFAIAITLLIIEFKIPHVTKDSTYESVREELVHLKYHLFSLLLSFALIATYWMKHHFLFKHIHNYNKAVVVANMFALLPIIFFPFTTAFLSESFENESVAFLALKFFLFNNILAGLTIYAMYWLVVVKHKEFSFEITRKEKRVFISESVFQTVAYILAFIIAFIIPYNLQAMAWTVIVCFVIKKGVDTWLKRKD